MAEDRRSITVDSDSQASNPGGVKVSPLRFWLHDPLWPTIWGGGLVLFVVLAVIFQHWAWRIPAGLFLIMNWLYWTRIREHFAHGCANPGVVVALNPTRIAVHTDLSMGEGEYPAVKIIARSLSRSAGQPVTIGTRVATVALYSPNDDDNAPYWGDFSPCPVDAATGNRAEQERVLRSIEQDEWDALEAALAQVPRPYAPGLYLIKTAEATPR